MGSEKVLVMLDVSKDVNCGKIAESLTDLPLYPGDQLILLGVQPEVTNKSTGHKNNVLKTSGPQKSISFREDFSRKEEQLYQIAEILKQSTLGKIKVDVELRVGSSRKAVVVEAAVNLGATWIILDRSMKKDKKYFMKNLWCKISKFKRNNTIDLLRGPLGRTDKSTEKPSSKSLNSNGQVSYGEMIPEYSWEELYQSPTIVVLNIYSIRQNPLEVISHNSSHQATNIVNTILAAQREVEEVTDRKIERSSFDDDDSPRKATYICSVCENSRPRISCHRDFKYGELYEATKGFSDENFLGEGGFGSVYKGELKNGLRIAVKQHKDASLQGEKEFKSEVEVLSKARHENLVMLLGSCSHGTHRLLVYEYVCNGSLDDHLSKNGNIYFTWEHRMKIALGTAKGLQYLHSHNIIHRDMRPNNILITHDYESLLGDFGLAKTQHDNNSGNSVVGTLGYMAPEYAQTGKFSTKTDVYSFGVVLLQLITGRRTTDPIPGGKSLIRWAKPLLKERNYPDLIDRKIIDSHDVLQLFWMVRLTENCISNDPCHRFTMDKVVNALTSIKNCSATWIEDISPISDLTISVSGSGEAEEYQSA
ncbi:OLC1v1001078C1 [Oldenlandia corymbosa var. corymbosa]|uniref:OLC1v1001078C1 n=1 Tax=Oldenlandia corymbosa var. corymbosa TaxID=529605 RepID=A0AAV1D5A0_OLDCO|nr:OLC1v1001078C1 [Oldenlandia corymbosa var. corymbosa]